jgi:hypothetical protein
VTAGGDVDPDPQGSGTRKSGTTFLYKRIRNLLKITCISDPDSVILKMSILGSIQYSHHWSQVFGIDFSPK